MPKKAYPENPLSSGTHNHVKRQGFFSFKKKHVHRCRFFEKTHNFLFVTCILHTYTWFLAIYNYKKFYSRNINISASSASEWKWYMLYVIQFICKLCIFFSHNSYVWYFLCNYLCLSNGWCFIQYFRAKPILTLSFASTLQWPRFWFFFMYTPH